MKRLGGLAPACPIICCEVISSDFRIHTVHIRFTLMQPVRLCTNAGVEASFIVCDSCSLSLSVIFSALCIWLYRPTCTH